jgi:hypothetical protein
MIAEETVRDLRIGLRVLVKEKAFCANSAAPGNSSRWG